MCIKTCEVLSAGLDVKVTDEWENQCSQHLFPKEERDRLGRDERRFGDHVRCKS